jgi:NodT family efflux transporter outer membrane factor (OMF) lipoprotein
MRFDAESLCVCLAALAVAGCGSVASKTETEESAATAIQQQNPELEQQWRSAADSGQVQAGWIDSFEDPTLTALVVEAQANNRNLAAAAANVDRAAALARRAGAAMLPEANLLGLGSRSGAFTESTTADSFTLVGLASWEVDVWGRLRAGRRAAVASVEAAEADLRSAQQSLAATTARAYFTAIEANRLVGISRDNVGILEETLRIVTVRFDNGAASGQDVALARSDLATAREQLVAIEGSHRDSLRALEAILGRYPGADLELGEILPAAPPPPPAGLPSDLLERRPDIVAAERRVAAAFNVTAQTRAARLPAINLTSNVSGASTSLSDLLDPANAGWSAGFNLLGPIFDGGNIQAAADAATADQDQALAQYGQTAINAFREVETQLDQGVVLTQRIAELEIALAEAENAFRIVRLRYDEGEEDLLSVLIIQRRLNTARSSLSAVQRLLLEQRINLNLALGGDWNS